MRFEFRLDLLTVAQGRRYVLCREINSMFHLSENVEFVIRLAAEAALSGGACVVWSRG